jgi:hypothetical protein
MIYRRGRVGSGTPGGFFHFQNNEKQSVMGYGHGDYIRLRDEYGTVWRGSAERVDGNTIRYVFRDSNGKRISGISDSYGIVLRDEKGNTWRGFVD